eukprot:gene6777-9283_t
MELFSSAPITSAGRPLYIDEEVEIKSEENVSIWLQSNKQILNKLFEPSLIILTNIRLIVINCSNAKDLQAAPAYGWCIYLQTISVVEDCKKFLSKSTRFRILFENNQIEIGLKFEHNQSTKSKDEFLENFQKVVMKKSWLKIGKTDINSIGLKSGGSVEDVNKFSASNVGVSGIIKRQENKLNNIDNLQKSALTDLDALIEKAREAIVVIQRYASYATENIDNRDENVSETTTEINEVNEMETIMMNIGIVSPVTKFSAGKTYHKQLARQIADVLLTQNRLQKLGGMITLTDLYCLLNKARGTELVSPDDLLKASALTGNLNIGISLKTFKSGVKVIQLQSFNEEAMCNNIRIISNENIDYKSNGFQASELAQKLGVSLLVAKEHILIAEKKGLLCRDESIRGLYFYPNLYFT